MSSPSALTLNIYWLGGGGKGAMQRSFIDNFLNTNLNGTAQKCQEVISTTFYKWFFEETT